MLISYHGSVRLDEMALYKSSEDIRTHVITLSKYAAHRRIGLVPLSNRSDPYERIDLLTVTERAVEPCEC